MSFNRPPERDYISVQRFFDQEAKIIDEERYIVCKEDIITLRPGRESAKLDAFLEKTLQLLSCKITRVCTMYHKERCQNANISSNSTSSVLPSAFDFNQSFRQR
jgi:hypothetical protein